MFVPRSNQPVLILGAGINGAALARELVLNNVPVIVVDSHDISSGATSRSSRLIHGGLRYLEYGDFALVRESLVERERLLKLAPQFVQPLRLFIPVRRRFGGLIHAALKFLGAGSPSSTQARGLWTVRLGLWLYDLCARSRRLLRSSVHRSSAGPVPHVDRGQFPWLCAYSDAQMLFPERFVVGLLDDARQVAAGLGLDFRVWTYHRAKLDGRRVRIVPNEGGDASDEFEPSLIINASGAAGDLTLDQLHVTSPRLFAGTKGSHFVTFHAGLRKAIEPGAVYAEAPDGRLIFVLPFGDGVLVGTTDEFFEGDPVRAMATESELEYLIGLVRHVFPDVGLTRADVALHYSGVRPLPVTTSKTASTVTRRHAIVESKAGSLSVLTLIGGKLTTCRQFAEEVTDRVLAKLHRPRIANTLDRPIPGGENYPADAEQLNAEWQRLSRETGHEASQVEAVWHLCGSRTAGILHSLAHGDKTSLVGTCLPVTFVRWVIEHEWVTRLEDLFERRLMLVFQPELSLQTLVQLAQMLVDATGPSSRESASGVEVLVDQYQRRLHEIYGRLVPDA
jgi:glycerol-3-phosphate dehydrogenase